MQSHKMKLPLLLQVFIMALCSGLHHRGPLRTMFPRKMPPLIHTGVDPGEPLFLTPYIEKGQIDKARQLSLIDPLPGLQSQVKMFSGYITVNKTYNSNMFFWFVPAQTGAATAPVLLWLQGGPGGASMFGNFVETGPYYVTADMTLKPRNVTWTSKYSVLYIDNPVGTGYSFTNDDRGYATNEDDVAENLYSALLQFFQLFPELQENEFYATGESYAGKYVPAITYKIHKEFPTAKQKINIRGMAIGDGLCDPVTMLPQYGSFLYNIGMLDENEKIHFDQQTAVGVKFMQEQKWTQAFEIFDTLLNGDTIPVPSYFTNVTGSSYYYNFLMTKEPKDMDYWSTFLSMSNVRKAIHVGNLTLNDGSTVEKHLIQDVMQSVKPWIAEIMNYYKVLMYSGQLDIIIASPLTEAFLQTVPWQYLDEYKRTKKMVWKSDGDVAGYVRQVHDFYQVIVRGGGHILPYDQPARSFEMIDRFISNKGFQ